jgi:hypothetical protein
MGSVFKYLDEYSIPAVDGKYASTIANNLNHLTEGLRKLIDTNHSRFNQLFQSISDAYYRVHKQGKKEIVSGQYQNQYGEGEMTEARENFSGNIERLVDKIQKNSLMKRNVILKPEAQQMFKERYNLGTPSIKKINDWFEDDDNENEIKYFFELLFTVLKPKNEFDVCQYDILTLASKITTAKKDEHLLKAKEILDHVLRSVLGTKFDTLGVQNLYKLRAVVAYAFMIYAKSMLCKKIT